LVPNEVPPGVYRVGRYWETLNAAGKTTANDLTEDCPSIMVVQPTDSVVKIEGTALPISKSLAIDPISKGCTDGTFLVGLDIKPGRYRVTSAGRDAYYERVDKNLKTINNDLSQTGSLIVTIKATDFAIKIQGTIAAV
jgi:hypothetical protein